MDYGQKIRACKRKIDECHLRMFKLESEMGKLKEEYAISFKATKTKGGDPCEK